jgi:phosphomannomutase
MSQELDLIARRWGAYASAQFGLTRKGASGAVATMAMMDRLRASPPRRIGDDEVVALADYQAQVRTDLRAGAASPLVLPKSNVIAFELASGGRVIARPSGTEPKAKFYFDVREEVRAGDAVATATGRAHLSMKRLREAFVALASG